MAEELLVNVGVAALAGATYGVVAYFKNKKQEDAFKGFDKSKFLVGVVGSALIGGIACYSGMTPDAVSASAVGVAVTQFLRKLFKGLL